ncbi:hypothetical protein CTI12_AA220400 [Artemisia annua]|uniref:Phosphoglycerate kinase n=1 Tax=Artemisia annua TaxID=35608 RepID=A0A2U1NWH8_ARTAN|nr:hypothetical protein CTI12_AA220400 [Artemisia annua]
MKKWRRKSELEKKVLLVLFSSGGITWKRYSCHFHYDGRIQKIEKNTVRHINVVKGRPKGVTPKYNLKPLMPRLSELVVVEVCLSLHLHLFYKEEEKNGPEFAKKLASLADLYVNDAFGTAHRAYASTEGVAKYLKPSVAGYLMQKGH